MRPVVTLLQGRNRLIAVGSDTFKFHNGKPKAVSDDIKAACEKINRKSGQMVFAIAGPPEVAKSEPVKQKVEKIPELQHVPDVEAPDAPIRQLRLAECH
jgi:hypothetical protein